jgi:hypothetical protein
MKVAATSHNQRYDGRNASARHDDVRRKRQELGRVPAQAGGVPSGPASVKLQVASDRPARLLQSLDQRDQAQLGYSPSSPSTVSSAALPRD